MVNGEEVNDLRGSVEYAYEEIKVHQEVISRKEGYVYQIRGWLFALITALVATLFLPNGVLTPIAFCAIGCIMVSVFLFLEFGHYRPIKRAMERVKHIEESIENRSYAGPSISREYGRAWTRAELMKELRDPKLWLPYALFGGIVVVLAIIASSIQ